MGYGGRAADQIEQILGLPEVDCGVDAVGFEARGPSGDEEPAVALNSLCPVMKYHRELMNAILNDRCQIAKAVNATVVTLADAPEGYQQFDRGAAKKSPNALMGCGSQCRR